MSARPWMPLYVADYLADTCHLSAEEHGAYLLLIMHYWQQGSLPDDDERLSRLCRLPMKRWLAIRPTIRPYFGEGWSHKRIDGEIAKSDERFRRLSEAGKRGGRPRKSESEALSDEKPGFQKAFAGGKAIGKPSESYSQPQENPIQEDETGSQRLGLVRSLSGRGVN